jgi:hypothetical protein
VRAGKPWVLPVWHHAPLAAGSCPRNAAVNQGARNREQYDAGQLIASPIGSPARRHSASTADGPRLTATRPGTYVQSARY